jgi:hypothetical protein
MQKISGNFFLASFLYLFFSISASNAQATTLFFDDQNVEPGTTISVDLKVSAFEDMVGMQFSVNWDPQILQYNTIENFGINEITLVSNFGLDSVGVGRLGFLWIDLSLVGVALPDSTVLFSIKFDVIGDALSYSSVSFSDIPTLIELSDGQGVISPELIAGTITVMEPNATVFNNAPDQIKIKECYPNPFSGYTKLDFEIANANNITLTVLDAKGQVVHEQKQFYSAGKHQITLHKELFPSAGIYYYKLVSNEYKVSQRLIYTEN